MIHITAATGLGLAFLLKAIVWSVAPIVGVGLVVLGVGGFAFVAVRWAIGRAKPRG